MGFKKCPECNKELSDQVETCPHCGHNLKDLSNKKAKKPTWVIVLAIICGCVGIVVFCSGVGDFMKAQTTSFEGSDGVGKPPLDNSTDQSNNISNEITNSTDKEFKKEASTSIEFVTATEDEIKKIPDIDGITKNISMILESIGITEIKSLSIGNYTEKPDFCMIDIKCISEANKNLIISNLYIAAGNSPKWTVSSVRNFDSGNYYYVPDEQITYVDLYDYETDSLLSSKSADPGNAVEDFEKRSEEIDKELEK